MIEIDSDGANELVDLLVFIHSSSAERGLIGREGKGREQEVWDAKRRNKIHGRGSFYRSMKEGEGGRETEFGLWLERASVP